MMILTLTPGAERGIPGYPGIGMDPGVDPGVDIGKKELFYVR